MVQVIRLSVLPSLALVAACASPASEYPSLAVRDIERVSGTMDVASAPPSPAPPAATLASLDDLAATARAAHQRFLASAPEARSLADSAAGAPWGSNSWARAQVAIADLEAQRSQAMIALADLDRIFVEAATSAQSTDSITAVRQEIDTLVAQQDAVIRSLLTTVEG